MTIDVNLPEKWEADYQRKTDGWDLRGPTPALKRLAESGRFPPGRMLVPCAGRGHDAREFARNGFSVTAVDFSPSAVQEMERLAEPEAPIDILQHDMFQLPESMNGTFEYVLQYTCFCAIDLKRRTEYADLISRLLKPGGIYIDLAFPLDGRAGGPLRDIGR
jgi:SAM-dependent methyltransferase